MDIPRLDSLEAFLHHCRLPDASPALYRLKPESEQGPAHSKWTREFLVDQTLPVNVHRSPSGNLFDLSQSAYELAASAVTRATTLGKLVSSFSNPNRQGFDILSGTDTHLVLEGGKIPAGRQALYQDISGVIASLLAPEELTRAGFWVSPRGVASQMHWDVNGHHNYNFQVTGVKEVVMFAPSDVQFTYQMPGRLFHLSRVDPRPGKSTLEDYPLFAQAKPWRAQLLPGDVLFIPCRWLHHFSHLGELNVNVTAWFSSPRSGEKWVWSDVIVAKPLEAWLLVLKLIFALALLAPINMLTSKEKLQLKATY